MEQEDVTHRKRKTLYEAKDEEKRTGTKYHSVKDTTGEMSLSSDTVTTTITTTPTYKNEIETLPETHRLLIHVFSVGVADIVLAYTHQVIHLRYEWSHFHHLSPSPLLETAIPKAEKDGYGWSEAVIHTMIQCVTPWLAPDGELARAVEAVREATTVEEWKRTSLHCHSVSLRLWASTGTAVEKDNVDNEDELASSFLRYPPKNWQPSHSTTLAPPLHTGCFAVALARVVAAESCGLGSGPVYARRVQAFWDDMAQWSKDVLPASQLPLYVGLTPHDKQNIQNVHRVDSNYSLPDTFDRTPLCHIHPLEMFTRLSCTTEDYTYHVGISTRYLRHFDSVAAQCAYALVVCSQGNYIHEPVLRFHYSSRGIMNILALNTELDYKSEGFTCEIKPRWSPLTQKEYIRAFHVRVLGWTLLVRDV